MSSSAESFELALEHHNAGRLPEAEAIYRKILAEDPRCADAWQYLGVLASQVGKHDVGVEYIERAIKLRPEEAVYYKNLGVVFQSTDQSNKAVECYRKALQLQPEMAEAHNGLGHALRIEGKLEEASNSFQKAISLNPQLAEAFYNLGLTRHAMGHPDQAGQCYRQAVQLRPNYINAWNNLGNAFLDLGEIDSAIASYQRAIQLAPQMVNSHYNLAALYRKQKNYVEAIASYQNAIAVEPKFVAAHLSLGDCLNEQGDHEKAIEAFRRANEVQKTANAFDGIGQAYHEIGEAGEAERHYQLALELNKAFVPALNNLATALQSRRQFEQAESMYREALGIDPKDAKIHLNFATTLSELKKYDEALEHFRTANELDPNSASALGQLVFLKKKLCDWKDLSPAAEKLVSEVSDNGAAIPPFVFVNLPETSSQQQLLCATQFVNSNLNWVVGQRQKLEFSFPAKPKDKLRIGYVSGDFRDHAMSSLFTEMFEQHDRTKFEVIAFDYSDDDGSDIQTRIRTAFDEVIDIRTQSHVAAAKTIYEAKIDILVDLMGHQNRSRNEIFGLRPAPLQVNYLAYPGTTGMEQLDYVLVDEYSVPTGNDPFFTEKLVHLPGTYQINNSSRVVSEIPTKRSDHGLPDDAFVFCCFNQSYKIIPQVYDVWMRLLQQVDKSVIWIWTGNQWSEENLRREAKARGVDPKRLVFAPGLPKAEHLERYRHADLALDTFPYGGHTTTSDALYCGCPVLALVGETFPSRVAGSVLNAAGLPELITESLDDYEATALRLATDAEELNGLRTKLLELRDTCALFDCATATQNIERAYLKMWDIWIHGDPPAPFAVGE